MSKKSFFKSAYGKIGLMLILLFLCLLSLRVGSAEMTRAEFFSALSGKVGFESQRVIIFSLRLPRILASLLAGAGLSLSGILLQSITGNELASPNIIGVNSGAGFVMICLLHFFPALHNLKAVGAFCGAVATTLLILAIASKSNSTKSLVILSGIAVTAVLNAAISFLSYFDTDLLADYNSFSVGGVAGVTVKELQLPFLIIGVCYVLAMLFSKRTDTLCLGDSLARSLGVNVKGLRFFCTVLAGASAAAVVSFAGLLGFVGLVTPHIARRLTDSSVEESLKVAPLLGGILVVGADLLGRTIFAPSEIPVGIVMAFIGAPFLFYLIARRDKYAAV